MKIKDLQKVLDVCIKKRITPLIWGQHGVGKSQIIKQYCEENNYEFIDIRLGQVEAGDLIGMPEREGKKTIWLKPEWFPTKGKGIIFLDEINRGKPDVLQAIFQLVLDKKLYTHELPKEWSIICAANPPVDEYNVVELDKALMNRFLHIKLNPGFEEWEEWAKNKGNISLDIINFLSLNKKMLNISVEWEETIKPKPTQRGWELFNFFLNEIMDDDLLLEIGSGIIGLEATKTFLKQKGNNFLFIDEKDLLDDFESKKIVLNKIFKEKKSNDVIYKLNERLLNYFVTKYNSLNEENKINMSRYLNFIPTDNAQAFMVALKKEGNTFNKYIEESKINQKLNEELNDKLLNKLKNDRK